jgi:catechol 2,3-dioxygenase-like lactoylglutathione lyase family enzyme
VCCDRRVGQAVEEQNRRLLRARQIYVLDQDQALDFYVGKLGLEVHTDADLGFMRWLTINVPGDPEREILLERPGPPSMNEETAAQVRDVLTKGAAGGHLFFRCDDAFKTHAELKAEGVELTEEPEARPYGIDFGLRDPFGNSIRIAQTP